MKRVQNFLVNSEIKPFTDKYVKAALGSNNWLRNMYVLGNLTTEIVVSSPRGDNLSYVGYTQELGFPSLYRLYEVIKRLLAEGNNEYDSDTAYLMAIYDDKRNNGITVEMYFLNSPMVTLRFKGAINGFKLYSIGGKNLGSFLTDLEDMDYLNFVFTDAISEITNSVPIPINRVGLWLEASGDKNRGLSVQKGCAVGFNDFSNGEYSMVILARK